MIADRTPEMPSRGRIIVAATSFADASSGTRIAAHLSARIEAELQGVFVEEEETAGLFANPSARFVTLGGTPVALPSPEDLRAALKRDALAFQREIAHIAQINARTWSFRTMQGQLFARLSELLQGPDILLLGYRLLHRLRGPVIRLGSTSRPEIAAGIATDLGVPLVEMAIGENGKPAAFDAFDAPVKSTLGDAMAMIARISASAIVIDTNNGPVRTTEQIDELLSAARCPVVLIGAPASSD